MRVLTILGLSGCPEKLGRVFPVIPVVRIIAGLRSWRFVFLFPTTGYLTPKTSASCCRSTSFFVRPSPLRERALDGRVPYEKSATSSVALVFGVIRTGFEPVTHSLEGCCSIQLSYRTNPSKSGCKYSGIL